MKRYLGWGSVGDTYIIACKLLKINDRVVMHHFTKHTIWYRTIMDIYKLAGNVMDVRFSDQPRRDLPELTTSCHEQDMEFFPEWNLPKQGKVIEKPYIVVQAHSGKFQGGNAKYIPSYVLDDIILSSGKKCVLMGLAQNYSGVGNCVNMIGQTDVFDVIDIVRNSEGFIGPEGFMSFVALSHKIRSKIYYTDVEALKRRVIDTPWEDYADTFIDMRGLWQ